MDIDRQREQMDILEIALYNVLTKLGATSDEAQKAVADVASSKDVATKADIKDMATKTDLAELETKLTKQMYVVAGIIIAAVGLMIKVL